MPLLLFLQFDEKSYPGKRCARQSTMRADIINALTRNSVLSQSFLLFRPTQPQSLKTNTTSSARIALSDVLNSGLPARFYLGVTQ